MGTRIAAVIRLWLTSSSIAACWWLLGAAAHAQDPGAPVRVRVLLVDCDAGRSEPTELVRLLRLELGSDGIDDVTTSATPTARVRVTVRGYPCDATSDTTAVTIDDTLTRKSVRREITLIDVGGPERPRAAALAIAELLRASWAELAFADDAEAPPAVLGAIERRLAERRSRTRSGPSFRLGGAGVGRLLPRTPVLLLGGRVALGLDYGASRFTVGALVFRSGRETDLGRIDLLVATGFAGAGLRVARNDGLALALDARIELGAVDANGDPRGDDVRAHDVVGVLALGAVELELAIHLAPNLSLTFGLELGVTLAGVHLRADAQDQANLSGLLLGLSTGLLTGTGSR